MRDLFVGKTALVVIDMQKGGLLPYEVSGISHMAGYTDRTKDYFIQKRRYSCFINTDLDILLRGLGVQTLLLVGNLTDVCVHYTFADAHQRDYHVRVLEDCVGGSSIPAHEASLRAMEYLQSGARRTSGEALAAMREVVPA